MKAAAVLTVFFISNYLYASYPETEGISQGGDSHIIGVFAARESRPDLHLLASEAGIMIYNIHYSSSLDSHQNCLRNVYMLAHGKDGLEWHLVKQAPLPNLIYDYSFLKNRKKSRKKMANALKHKLKEQGIPFMNDPSLVSKVSSKKEFAVAMKQAELSHPETHNYSEKNISDLLEKYGFVFVKPTYGSGGKGILKIERDATQKNKFNLAVNLPKNAILPKQVFIEPISDVSLFRKAHFKDVDYFELLLIIHYLKNNFFQQFQDNYIVQQGIRSFSLSGKKCDLRVTTQRNEDNKIVITGSILRVGENISQGGYFANPSIILEFAQGETEKLINDAYKLALRAHAAMESLIPGKYFAELGSDIVFDKSMSPVIIEANAKPGYISIFENYGQQLMDGKAGELHRYLTNMDQMRNKTILGYSFYLKSVLAL